MATELPQIVKILGIISMIIIIIIIIPGLSFTSSESNSLQATQYSTPRFDLMRIVYNKNDNHDSRDC